MIYAFYLYNREGKCIFFREWNRKRISDSTEEDQKLMFGLLYSLKDFCSKMSPTQPCAGIFQKFEYVFVYSLRFSSEGLSCFRTNSYKLHYFETLTGLKFLLTTDETVPNLREQACFFTLSRVCPYPLSFASQLRALYSDVYVQYASKNPLQNPRIALTNELFVTNLNRFVEGLPCFK